MATTNGTGVVRAAATAADLELFAEIEKDLYTAVVSDSLDDLGYRDQAMREHLRPLFPNVRFAGWARTITCVDVYHIPSDPYETEIEAEFAHESGAEVTRVTREFERFFSGRNAEALRRELRQAAPQGVTEGSLFVPPAKTLLRVLQ